MITAIADKEERRFEKGVGEGEVQRSREADPGDVSHEGFCTSCSWRDASSEDSEKRIWCREADEEPNCHCDGSDDDQRLKKHLQSATSEESLWGGGKKWGRKECLIRNYTVLFYSSLVCNGVL